jgi:hypothetical protein
MTTLGRGITQAYKPDLLVFAWEPGLASWLVVQEIIEGSLGLPGSPKSGRLPVTR